MTTLFIITQVRKKNPISLGENSFQTDMAEPDEKPYTTYEAAASKIPSLGVGIFQIEKIFINQQ